MRVDNIEAELEDFRKRVAEAVSEFERHTGCRIGKLTVAPKTYNVVIGSNIPPQLLKYTEGLQYTLELL